MNDFPLIGRLDVLRKIDSLIKESNSQHIICIEAEGGVGKTRLLQEIFNIYQKRTGLKTINTLDFDDENFLSPKYTGLAIAKELGEENFSFYFKEQYEYHQMMLAGVSIDILAKLIFEIRKKFEDSFNKVSAKKRIILSFDTTDKLEKGKGMWQEFKSIANLQNICVLLAGRNAHQIGDWLKQEGILTVENIQLLPLSEVESELYLEEKQRRTYITGIKKELVKKIVRLCEGRPILLDLSIEWICQDINLDWVEQISEDETDQFKSLIIERVKYIQHPAGLLIHLMAYIYPLSKEMIAYFMNIDTQHLFSKVKEYVFVKSLPDGCISLHDEFRSMIIKYVYPLSDEIRGYSREAALFFKEKSVEFKNRSKEAVDKNDRINFERQRYNCMERQVDYAFLYNIEEGINHYKDVIWRLRHASRTRVALRIQDKRNDDLIKFDEKQKRAHKTLRARLLNDLGKADEAARILEELIKEEINDKERADICNAFAPVLCRLGKLEKALNHQLEALRLLEKTDKDYLPDLANYAGYLYERLGKLDKAVVYYNKAYTYSLRNKKSNELTVKILDNLSYAYCQQGLYRDAKNYLDKAKNILSKNSNQNLIARIEITEAVLCRDQGKYKESLFFLEKAIKRLKEPDDHQKMSKAFFHRGWTCWFQALAINDATVRKNTLKESKTYFKRSLQLAEQYHLEVDMPGILHQMSHVYYMLEERERAVNINNKAYKLSRETNDIRYAIDSLVGKAEFDYGSNKFNNLSKYAVELTEEFENKGYWFPRFYGRMKRILAEAAFKDEKYDESLDNYIAGLAQIRLHSGYAVYTIEKELERLEENMKNLTDEQFYDWCLMMSEKWSERTPHEKYLLLLNWCNKQLASR